jgi:outer membrane protein assembly factor BamB
MAGSDERQRTGRAYVWALALVVLAVGGLAGYQLLKRPRFASDSALLRDLQVARLDVTPPADTRPGEWPQWRGPHRDGVSRETGLRTEWPAEGPPVLWEVKTGQPGPGSARTFSSMLGYSSFAVADGRVFTTVQDGNNETVVCWQADSGKELWRHTYECRYDNDFGSGPRSTPTVEAGRLYAVGVTGIFHCLAADDGKVLWRHDLLKEFNAPNLRWGVSFSPLVEDKLVFTNPGGPNGNSVAAFDKATGKLAWKALDDPAGYSSPIAVTAAGVRQVVFFTGSGLVGLDPKDGKVYWRYPWETSYGCNIATPISRGDYLLISSGYGRGCALLKIVATANGSLEAKRVYEHDRLCNHFSTSVLVGEHVYGFNDAVLTCMEFRTGHVVAGWKGKGLGKGSLLAADGQLVILGENGRLVVAEATSEGYRENASWKVSGAKCWSVPVLASGRLYVRDEDRVACLDLRTP